MQQQNVIKKADTICKVAKAAYAELTEKSALGRLRQSSQFAVISFAAKFESLQAMQEELKSDSGKTSDEQAAKYYKFSTIVLEELQALLVTLGSEVHVLKLKENITELVNKLHVTDDSSDYSKESTTNICESLGIK